MKPARKTSRSFLHSLRNDYTKDQEGARFESTTIEAKIVTSRSKLLLGLAAGIADVATTSHVTSPRDTSSQLMSNVICLFIVVMHLATPQRLLLLLLHQASSQTCHSN